MMVSHTFSLTPVLRTQDGPLRTCLVLRVCVRLPRRCPQ